MSHETTKGAGRAGLESFGEAPGGKNFLLAIAIDEYVHCPSLSNCVKDAQDLIEVLTGRYRFEAEHVRTLFNERATRPNIHEEFKHLKGLVGPSDNLIVFFSGHGETEDGVGYWVPVDAHPEREYEFLAASEIKARLDAIDSFHTFVIADACFSGSFFVAYKSIKLGSEAKRSRLGLTASHSRERALDGPAGDNSPFARQLLQSLRDSGAALSVHQLAANVIQGVEATTRGRQTPVFRHLDVRGDEMGQFVFHLRADEAADWKACREAGTIAAYEAFLAHYPEGRHVNDARSALAELREETRWLEATEKQSIVAYYNYLQHHRDGRHAEAARAAIRALEEAEAWNQARKLNSISAYDEYLEKYPQGKQVQEARQYIQALLESRQATRRPAAKRREPVNPAKPKTAPEGGQQKSGKAAAKTVGSVTEPPAERQAIIRRRWYAVAGLLLFVFLGWRISHWIGKEPPPEENAPVQQNNGSNTQPEQDISIGVLTPKLDAVRQVNDFLQNYPGNTLLLKKGASGLKYRVIEAGSGPQPKTGDQVQVHYYGTLTDGKALDNSYDRGEPFTFTIGQGRVIPGWEQGIPLLREGAKAILMIPPILGYGVNGSGSIPGNATLVFYVELVKVN